MIWLWACTLTPNPETVAPPVKESPPPPVQEDSADPQQREQVQVQAAPYACPGTILVPEAAYAPVDDVLALPSQGVVGFDPEPKRIHLGSMGPGSVVMIWTTGAETLLSDVEVQTDAGTTVIHGASFTLLGDAELRRVHEVRVCGLSNTLKYRVGGEGAWSQQYTVQMPGTDEVTAIVVGDTRGNPTTWRAILQASESWDPDMLLFTGDAVSSGTSINDWWDWLDAGEGILEHRILLSAHGNHEYLAQAWFGLMGQPGIEQWFSYDLGPAHLVFFNDSGLSSDLSPQMSWLASDLAASASPWKISLHHQPGFSSSDVHPVNITVRDTIVPILEAGGVNLDLAGHNHHYERMLPMKGGVFAPGGITYVVTAGGGASLYPNDGNESYSVVVAVIEHFTVLHINKTQIDGQAIDLGGNVLDHWTLSH